MGYLCPSLRAGWRGHCIARDVPDAPSRCQHTAVVPQELSSPGLGIPKLPSLLGQPWKAAAHPWMEPISLPKGGETRGGWHRLGDAPVDPGQRLRWGERCLQMRWPCVPCALSLGSAGTLPEPGDRRSLGRSWHPQPQHRAMLLLQPRCPGGAPGPPQGAAATSALGCGWEPAPRMWAMLERGTLALDRRAYGTHKLVSASFQKLTSQNSPPEAVLSATCCSPATSNP